MAYFIDGVEYAETEYEKKKIEIRPHVDLINDYVSKIRDGEITLGDVPEEYYQEVYNVINAPEPESVRLYTLDEASEIISQEVSK